MALLEALELGVEVVELLSSGDAPVDDVASLGTVGCACACARGDGSLVDVDVPHDADAVDVVKALSALRRADATDAASVGPLLNGAPVDAEDLFSDARFDIARATHEVGACACVLAAKKRALLKNV